MKGIRDPAVLLTKDGSRPNPSIWVTTWIPNGFPPPIWSLDFWISFCSKSVSVDAELEMVQSLYIVLCHNTRTPGAAPQPARKSTIIMTANALFISSPSVN